MELGSISDWVSTGANVVMASAAVYAAYSAKDWLSSKKSNDAYKHASSIMLLLNEINELHNDVVDFFTYYPHLATNKDIMKSNIALSRKINDAWYLLCANDRHNIILINEKLFENILEKYHKFYLLSKKLLQDIDQISHENIIDNIRELSDSIIDLKVDIFKKPIDKLFKFK